MDEQGVVFQDTHMILVPIWCDGQRSQLYSLGYMLQGREVAGYMSGNGEDTVEFHCPNLD